MCLRHTETVHDVSLTHHPINNFAVILSDYLSKKIIISEILSVVKNTEIFSTQNKTLSVKVLFVFLEKGKFFGMQIANPPVSSKKDGKKTI